MTSTWRSPPEAERFLGITRRKDRQYLPLYPTFESAEISPKHCLESKWAYGTQKYTHNVCVNVNRLNSRTRSACDVQNHTVRSHCRNKRRHVNYLYMICNCMNIGPTHCQDTELGSISGGDPGGPGGQRTPTFLSRIRL